jgi:transposase
LEQKIDRNQAGVLLEIWLGKAKKLANESMDIFIAFYQKWQQYILNYFTYRVSTSVIEGINNKIKLIKRRLLNRSRKVSANFGKRGELEK